MASTDHQFNINQLNINHLQLKSGCMHLFKNTVKQYFLGYLTKHFPVNVGQDLFIHQELSETWFLYHTWSLGSEK